MRTTTIKSTNLEMKEIERIRLASAFDIRAVEQVSGHIFILYARRQVGSCVLYGEPAIRRPARRMFRTCARARLAPQGATAGIAKK